MIFISEEPIEDSGKKPSEESSITINTDILRSGDLEDTYYVDGEIYELTGTLTGGEQVENVKDLIYVY